MLSASREKYDNINSTASAPDSNIIAANAKYERILLP
jgi:hypothetical protein